MAKIITDKKIIDKVLSSFARTTDEIYSLDEFKKLLLSGRQLRMKYGVDVTAPNLHIGHAVNLWMYRKLQELGHKMVFLIGDFTTQIGDPTGKSKTRPVIPIKEIKKNAKEFIKQAKMVLFDKPGLIEIRGNAEWYGKMKAKDFISLMSMVTHNRLIERGMFQQRLKEGKEIYLHEMAYPVLQGYDSVMLKSDLTIIGSDQLFNEMMGRFMQEKFSQPPQVVITTKITAGIDGREKQSKSLNNYIGLSHTPREKFGRLMSISDNLIIDYLRVYTEIPLEEIIGIEKDLPSNPMKYKLLLAEEVVSRYHGKEAGQKERQWFEKTFSERTAPADVKRIEMESQNVIAFGIVRKCFPIGERSNSEIRRLFEQKAVEIDDEIVTDRNQKIRLKIGGSSLKIGKRHWFKAFSK